MKGDRDSKRANLDKHREIDVKFLFIKLHQVSCVNLVFFLTNQAISCKSNQNSESGQKMLKSIAYKNCEYNYKMLSNIEADQ